MKQGTNMIRTVLGAMAVLLLLGMTVPAEAGMTFTYTHTDLQGNVVAKTDQSGTVIERRSYEPYGLPKAELGTLDNGEPGYTGHVHDTDSGLVYMQQRYYDPMTGRFLSTDPVGVSASTGGNFNRYAYANNNPYKYVDPDGRLGCPRQLGNRCTGAQLSGVIGIDAGGGEKTDRPDIFSLNIDGSNIDKFQNHVERSRSVDYPRYRRHSRSRV